MTEQSNADDRIRASRARRFVTWMRAFRLGFLLLFCAEAYGFAIAVIQDVARQHFPGLWAFTALGSALGLVLTNWTIYSTLQNNAALKTNSDLTSAERRRRSKAYNERLKLSASFTNTVAGATLIGAFVNPLMRTSGVISPTQTIKFGVLALALHLSGHAILSTTRSEE